MAASRSVVDLVGRESERAALDAALDVIATGRAFTLLIEGEAGIGKTRLADELVRQASERGVTVLAGRADELDRRRACGPLLDALRDVRAVPAGGSDDVLTDAVVDAVEGLAVSGTPVLLLVEDLHWADDATIVAMRAIARRLPYLPVLIAGTYRPHPQPDPLPRLVDAAVRDGATVLSLDPLGADDAIAMAEAMIGAGAGPRLSAMVAAAAGNPLFVGELIRSLADEGAITQDGAIAESSVDRLPSSLRVTILRRLSFLPSPTLDTLRFAAVLGSTFTAGDLSAVLHRSVRDLLADLGPALQAKVVDEAGTLLRFRHDLIREAIYEDIPASVRASMHLEVARALSAHGVAAQRVGEHLIRAPESASDLADLLEQTAERLAPTAPRLTLDLYERALSVMDDGPRADAIRVRMLWPLMTVGRGDESLAIAERLLQRTKDPATEIAIRNARLRVLQREGRGAATEPEIRSILDDPRFTDDQKRFARAALAHAFVVSGRAPEARTLGDEVASDAERAGDRETHAAALMMSGYGAVMQGDSPAAIERLRRVGEMDREQPLNAAAGWAGMAIALIQADRLADARQTLAEGRSHDAARGAMTVLATYAHIAAAVAWYRGDWDDALAEARTGLRMVEEEGGSLLGLYGGLTVMGWIAVARGDDAASDAALDTFQRLLAERGPGFGVEGLLMVQTLRAMDAGDHATAYANLCGFWDGFAPIRFAISWTVFAPDLVRMALEAGDLDRARDVVEGTAEGARRAGGVPSADGAALRCRGLFDDDPDAMRAAAEAYRKSEKVIERALGVEDAAAVIARAGETGEARALFEESLAVYEECGATRLAARTTAAMRDAGIRRGSKSKRQRPAFGWESLTPSELAVARMAAEGLTNPQIAERLVVSKYTVMTHLQHVFTKLGIASRVELAARVAREDT